ncbi:hypothetical protein OXX69_013195, partial [Metschnikowia pulcherrima]
MRARFCGQHCRSQHTLWRRESHPKHLLKWATKIVNKTSQRRSKKPPQELGISIPAKTRRPSLSSLSPRSSVEKERGGFFKRRSSVAEQANSGPTNSDKGTKTITGKPQKPKRQLRRVSFALDKLDADPQQQIPSRRPRKGNV